MNKYHNRDIMDWEAFPDYDLVWTDPPWEDKMVKFFQTALLKDTGKTVAHTIHDVLGKLAGLCDRNKLVVVEYGVKGHELVIETMVAAGHVFKAKYERPQSNGRPFILMVFNGDIEIKEGLKGFDVVTESLKCFPPGTRVFDPFAGIGATKKAVVKAGLSYEGSELNPVRYARLIKD